MAAAGTPKYPSMQTPRLNLVRLTPKHLGGYHAIWSDPVATRWFPYEISETLEESAERMFDVLSSQNLHSEHFAVFLRDDIDMSGLRQNNTHPINSNADSSQSIFEPGFLLGIVGDYSSGFVPQVGFIYHRSAWGYGFATEALTVYLEMLWERPQFNVVEAECDSENHASANVLRKCGFEVVEILTGKYEIPWKKPSARDYLRFRLTRP
ncbi:uncharacterized protein N7503_004505 [Penicillium pulvis]|uniref:uncharacterized protein n=1 Tax=Penicillium pulvis TaxID=1562058 RepID=UPI0025485D62|nr:uncharacterized protein N7503_004505 [Penicillium pulvis]KAJ5802055.1 hypothetical protein N7503_004505 [Penicillium pulvis]